VSTAEPIIRLAGVTKRFGRTVAVDDVTIDVPRGRCLGWLGPNGSGKTTLIRCMLGLARVSAGTIEVRGREVPRDVREALAGVGAIVEEPRFYPYLTGRRNLEVAAGFVGHEAFGRIDDALGRVDLAGAAGTAVKKYSLGMRQRLGLAAALLGDPRVLVLDEPANGLDPQGIRWLRDFLRMLASEGRAVLVSSHVLAEVAQTADDVVVINHGRSIAQAPLSEIMARSGGGMKVAGPDVRKLGDLLFQQGAEVSGDSAEILVKDRTGEQIGRVVAEHQLVISELAPVGSSLEEVYLELTGSTGGPS